MIGELDGKKKRGCNFTMAELMALARSWLAITQDPVVGCDPKSRIASTR